MKWFTEVVVRKDQNKRVLGSKEVDFPADVEAAIQYYGAERLVAFANATEKIRIQAALGSKTLPGENGDGRKPIRMIDKIRAASTSE